MSNSLYRSVILSLLLYLIFSIRTFVQAQVKDTLTIEECINLALKNNPDIKLAESNVEIARATLTSTRSPLFPQISLQSNWSKNGGYFFNGPNAIQRSFQNYSAGIQGQMLLFDFGKTYSRVSASSDITNASEQDAVTTRQSLILDTYIAYFTYLEASRVQHVTLESVAQAEEHLKQSENFFKVGTKPQFDVLKARTDLANARVNLLTAENNVSLSRLQLENLLSVKLSDNFVLQDNLEVSKDSVALDEAMNKAFANRPELIASKYRIDANKSLLTSAWSANLPSISATGGYNYRAFAFDQQFLNSWNVGVVFSLPLFQGFALDAGIDAARAGVNNAQAQYDNYAQAVTLDVQQQYTGLTVASAKIDAAKFLLTQAEETAKLAEGRYREGIGSPIEITDARITLLNAQQVYIQSLYDYQVAYVRLQKAMGTLY